VIDLSETARKINFLSFNAINEPWNEYKLEDGSTLRVKVILSTLIKENGSQFAVSFTPVFGVIPSPKLVGIPSPPLKTGEKLEDYIQAEDLKIIEKTDLWNEYEVPTENMRLGIKGEVVLASRTSRHDEKGLPIYTINVQVLLKPKKKTK